MVNRNLSMCFTLFGAMCFACTKVRIFFNTPSIAGNNIDGNAPLCHARKATVAYMD